MAEITYIKNNSLKTILPDWQGNPSTNGKFFDPVERFKMSFTNVLKWQLGDKPKKAEKKADTWRLKVLKDTNFLNTKENCLVWLGHASFFLQLNGVRIITDPVFGRISGVVPRFSELPCAVSDIKNIDYILLSHGHRDHCDKSSLQALAANNNATLLTSLNTAKNMVSRWVPGIKYQEAGWYQQYDLPQQNLRITYLPAQHWSNRFFWDTNQTLWGSMMIEADGLNIFFGGDSGYCGYPKKIAELFPNIDIAMIGVGAYTPSFIMKYAHTSPEEAVQVFHDLKAKTFIPMHYGTFDLADEPLGDPHRILTMMQKHDKINGDLRLLDVGEVMVL